MDKLQTYKDKITQASSFDREFGELIAIELFDFIIKENQVLINEFERRFFYLKKLSVDKKFIKLQDDLFNTIVSILNLVGIKEAEKAQEQEEHNEEHLVYKCINKLNMKEERLTLPKFFQALKDKNNYYRLHHGRSKSYYSPLEGEISKLTHIIPVKKQYELIVNFLNKITFDLSKNKSKIIQQLDKLFKKFNDLYYELDDKIYRIPKKLHTQQFEDFFYFCTQAYNQRGHSFIYDFNKPDFFNEDHSRKLKKAKTLCSTVIDDLIFFLKESYTKPTLTPDKKLFFYPDSGAVSYKGESCNFTVGKKHYELLNFLYQSKNTPFNSTDIKNFCNDKIRIEKHGFKTEKDISDTISYIRRKLKVKKGEYFPVYKRGKSFIWEEK